MKRAAFFSVFCLLMFAASIAVAQKNRVINQVSAQRVGLRVQWTSQIQVDPTVSRISGVFLHVGNKQSTTTYELTYGKQREVISEFDYGPNGKMFGDTGAKEWAELRQEILKEGRNIEAKIEKFVTPKIVLYATTTDGVVQAIDCSNGKTLWATSVGERNLTTTNPSANDQFVTVVNGSSLHCLRADTGKFLWKQVLKGAAGDGPAMSDDFAFVPLVNGFVEAFPLWDNTDPKDLRAKEEFAKPKSQKSKQQIAYEEALIAERVARFGRVDVPISRHPSLHHYVSAGEATTTPTVTALTTSWPTLRGHYNVGYNSRDNVGKMIFRLKTGGPIYAPGSHQDEKLFVGSTDGFVFALDERDGQLLWDFGTGEPISQSPIPIGDYVYAITDDMGLYKIEIATGDADSKWPTRLGGIKSFLAASKTKIYAFDNLRRLVVIEQETGAIVSRTSSSGQDFRLYNLKTDRIYVGTTSGTIQCLHEVGANHPMIHTAPAEKQTKPDAAGKPKTDDGKAETNPFDVDKKKDDKKKKDKNPFDTDK